MRILALIFLIPLLYTVAFFIYAGLSNDPGCGSQDPGLCFGAGVMMMLAVPLALLTTPASIIFYILHRRKLSKNQMEISHE